MNESFTYPRKKVNLHIYKNLKSINRAEERIKFELKSLKSTSNYKYM